MTTRQHRTPEQWEAIYQDWQSSGLSMPKFCTKIKIPSQSLYNYSKRRQPKEPIQAEAKATTSFVELGALSSPPASSQSMEIVLDVGQNIQLRIRYNA